MYATHRPPALSRLPNRWFTPVVLLLAAGLAAGAAPAEPVVAIVALALRSPDEAFTHIARMSEAEQATAVRALLAAPKPRAHELAGRVAREFYRTDDIDVLRQAAQNEANPGVAENLKKTADFLAAYKNIELPREERQRLHEEARNQGSTMAAAASRPVQWNLTVLNARGEPVPGALVKAYCPKYGLMVPSGGFASADAGGRLSLAVAPGAWSVVAANPPAYAKGHKGRGVFLVCRNVQLTKSDESLVLRPITELVVSIYQAGEADTVHLLDRALADEVAFPSLGGSVGRQLTVETTGDAGLALVASGFAEPRAAWVVWQESLPPTGAVVLRPTGKETVAVTLEPPKAVLEIKSARFTLSRHALGPTAVALNVMPGMVLSLTAGATELEYSVVASQSQFVYWPGSHEWAAGQRVAFPLDAPRSATVFQELKKKYDGRDNVLLASVIAADANGHFLRAYHGADRQPAPLRLRVTCGSNVVADFTGPPGSLNNEIVAGLAPEKVPLLRYRLGADLWSPVAADLAVEPMAVVESAHFRLQGPASATARMKEYAKNAEWTYEAVLRQWGRPPRWSQHGILFHPLLEPGSGGSAGGGNVHLGVWALLGGHGQGDGAGGVFTHELLHAFGFGHDDMMDIWGAAVRRGAESGRTPTPVSALPGQTQRNMLLTLRGEPAREPGEAARWLVLADHGIDPFRQYQEYEKVLKPRLQAVGLNESESFCIILSWAVGEDLGALYRRTEAPVRVESLARAKPIIAAWQSESSGAAAASGSPAARESAALQRLRQAFGAAAKGDAAAIRTLRQDHAAIHEIPLIRQRVVMCMQLGEALHRLGAKTDAYDAFRQAQREAAKVSMQYVSTCRRLTTEFLLGEPLRLGHM